MALQICITKNTVPNCNGMPIKTVSITVISTTKIGLHKVQTVIVFMDLAKLKFVYLFVTVTNFTYIAPSIHTN